MLIILVSFIGAIIKTCVKEFPFIEFAGILNGLGLGSYLLKTFGSGEKERRLNNFRGDNEIKS